MKAVIVARLRARAEREKRTGAPHAERVLREEAAAIEALGEPVGGLESACAWLDRQRTASSDGGLVSVRLYNHLGGWTSSGAFAHREDPTLAACIIATARALGWQEPSKEHCTDPQCSGGRHRGLGPESSFGAKDGAYYDVPCPLRKEPKT